MSKVSLDVRLQPGWLKRQADLAEKDMLSWPEWMKQEFSRLPRDEYNTDNSSYGNY